ncbi:MAG: dynamin family protein [Akkermansia sp.]|nr:dynamin family protein [Akkermansia sp.]
MNIQDILQSALSLSEKYKTSTQTERLRSLAEAIKQDKLKVVVLGDFKAGKSTLLNRLFIRKDMLPTDHLEATAVPTHLSNGSMGMNTWMRNPDGEDVLVTERRTFTDADVAATVTAATEEERASKAQRYSRVSITMPGILPENIILVDTPGLNTPNTAIYCGTLAEARTADAILYVVRAKQLSSREQALITDLAGGQQLKVPVHIILTHDSADNIAQSQLQNICQAIQAQLKLCKVNCGVSVFSLDGHSASTSSVAERINTSFDDGFGFGEVPAAAPVEATAETGDIESELLAFFNGEVRRGRAARIARELTPLLASLKAAVQARLTMAEANEAEIKKIEEKKAEIQQEYLRVVKSLLMDVRTAQYTFSNNVVSDLDALRDKHIDALNKLQTTGDILASISDWHQDMPQELQRVLTTSKLDLERDIMAICQKHNQAIKDKLAPDEIETNMPSDWLTKFVNFVPNWALILADYIIFDIISPLPSLLDVPLRMIADKVPFIRDLMPANIAASLARTMAGNKLTECIKDIQQQVHTQLDAKFDELNQKLKAQLQEADIFAEQDAAIAEFRNGTLTIAQKQQLEAEMKQIAQWSQNI